MAGNNVYKWIVSMAIVISVMINFESVANGQKLSGKIDVAIMLAPYADGNGMYKRSVIKMVNDHLDMGDDKVRVVLFDTARAKDYNVLHPMTGDQGAIVGALEGWNPKTAEEDFHAVSAMQSCKWGACGFKKDEANNRAKAIIFHAQYYTEGAANGAHLAFDMRRFGAYVYFVNNPDTPTRFADWTGSPTRLFPMSKQERDETTSLKMPEIINAIEKDLCGFCRYNAPGQQECGWKRFEADDPMYFGSDHSVCSSAESSCGIEQCEWVCNQQWPWSSPETDLDPLLPYCEGHQCGPMRRNPVLPTSNNVENCVAEFDCGKPECPTTTSTTTSTIASTTSPTESSSTTTESKLTTAAAEKEVGGDKSAPSDSEGFPVWAIGVIAVVAVLLLVAIIGFVVLKKRKATREKKEKMERAKRQEEIERMEMEKKRRATSRSKSVSAGKDASIGSKKSKGADASMLADISMATVAARQSKKPSSAVACKIKSKPSLPSKSPSGKHESKGGDEKPSSKKSGVEGSKLTTVKSSQPKGKSESKSNSRVVKKKSEPSKMGSSSKVSKKK